MAPQHPCREYSVPWAARLLQLCQAMLGSMAWVPSFPDIRTAGSYGQLEFFQPSVAADPGPEAMATMYMSALLPT